MSENQKELEELKRTTRALYAAEQAHKAAQDEYQKALTNFNRQVIQEQA